MFRRVTLALAVLSALTGCVGSPPKGPFVQSQSGTAPLPQPVRCEADYALVAKNPSESLAPIAVHHLAKGECLGFRREPNGSLVAIAPGYVIPLPPGSYAWEVVRGSVPPWHERLWSETRQRTTETGRASGILLGACFIVAAGLAITVGLLAAMAYDRKHPPQGSPPTHYPSFQGAP